MMKKCIYVFMDSVAMILLWAILIKLCHSFATTKADFLLLGLGLIVAGYQISLSVSVIIKLILDIHSGLQKKEVRFSVATDKEGMEFLIKVKYIDLFFENADMQGRYRFYSDKMPHGIKTGDTLQISYYPRTRIIEEMEKL